MNENITPNPEERTFSQDDVNRIIQERLAKEKAKSDAAIAQREQELAHREFMLTAKEKLAGKKLSPALLDALNVSSPEAFEKSLEIIERELMTRPKGGKSQLRITDGDPPDAGDPVRDAMGL